MRLPHPRRSSFGIGALVIAGLATTQALNNLVPDSSTRIGEGLQRAFPRDVAVGGSVDLRSGTLAVTGVEGATTLREEFRVPLSTPGVFVVVRFDWTARGRADGIADAVVVDRAGRRFLANAVGSARNKVTCRVSTPGVTQQCVAVVELPRDAVAGATMTLANNMWQPGYDEVARIDLGITDAEAEAFGTGESATITTGYEGLT